jgi:hypothetical protein
VPLAEPTAVKRPRTAAKCVHVSRDSEHYPGVGWTGRVAQENAAGRSRS